MGTIQSTVDTVLWLPQKWLQKLFEGAKGAEMTKFNFKLIFILFLVFYWI